MIADPPRLDEIELQPVFSKGQLVVDEWWAQDPPPKPDPLYKRFGLEILTLALPIAFALIYQIFIAAPRFVAESQFMVRTLGNSEVGNIATLLSDQKVTRASDETYAVTEYLTSRDAVDTLVQHDGLKAILDAPQADIINRFPNFYTRNTRERLYKHFQNFVDLDVSAESGIAKLNTVAFTPQDAVKLNKAMLLNAEGFVNRLNEQMFSDTLAVAKRDLEQEKDNLTEIEKRLTALRNKESVIDPTKEGMEALTRIGSMMTRLSQAESQLAQETTLAPRSPQLASLASQVNALKDQISVERGKLAGKEGSLSSKFGEFDAILLDRTLASKQLEAALAEYTRAREDSARQHFYLQTVVDPEAPDQATEPRRALDLFLTAAICMCVYSILRAIIKNIREHVA